MNKKKAPIKEVVLNMQTSRVLEKSTRAANVTIEQLAAFAYLQGVELVIQFKKKEQP
jgi:hypothetical protein